MANGQQPLGGRSLSSVVLQAPDIIGEARQAQLADAQAQAAAQKAQKPEKPFKLPKVEGKFGTIFSPLQGAMVDKTYKWIIDNHQYLNENSPSYDLEKAAELERLLNRTKQLGSTSEDISGLYSDDAEGKTLYEQKAGGTLDYLKTIVNDFPESLTIMNGDYYVKDPQTGEMRIIDQTEYFTNPQSMWGQFIGADRS